MNRASVDMVKFGPDADSDKAFILGSELPFHWARAEIRSLPGDVIVIYLRRDHEAEQREALQIGWAGRILDFLLRPIL